MKKREVSIFDYKDGDILATDIYNEYGVLIVAINTELNSYVQEKLIEHHISRVYVVDHEIKEEQPLLLEFYQDYEYSLAGMKRIISNLVSENKLNVQEVNYVTQMIFDNIKHGSSIIPLYPEFKKHG